MPGGTDAWALWDDLRWEYTIDDGASWTAWPFTGNGRAELPQINYRGGVNYFYPYGPVTSLSNGTSYTFKVRAKRVNSQGTVVSTGAASDAASATPQGTPSKPNLWGESRGYRTVTLWMDLSHTTDVVTHWQVSIDGGAWKQIGGSRRLVVTDVSLSTSGNHTFKVRAFNGTLVSPESDTITVNARSNQYVDSIRLELTSGNGEVVMRWWPVPGPPVDGCFYDTYLNTRVKRSQSADASNAPYTYTYTGGLNNTSYRYQVVLFCHGGNRYIGPQTWGTPRAIYPAPTGLTAAPKDGGVELSWEQARVSGVAADGFQIKDHPDLLSWRTIEARHVSGNKYTATLWGLKNDQSYSIKMRAFKGNGQRAHTGWGTESSAVSVTPRAAVSDLKAVSGAAGSAVLSWTAPSGTVAGYKLEQDYGGALTDLTVTSSGTTRTATVTGLTNGREYVFRVAAVYGTQTGSLSNSVRVTPVVEPDKPELRLIPGDSQINLSFSAWGVFEKSRPIMEWQYRQGGSSGAWHSIPGTRGLYYQKDRDKIPHQRDRHPPSHNVTGLANGTAYSFEVRAVTATGMSPVSDSVSATPTADVASWTFTHQPTEVGPSLTATAKNEGVLLTWTAGNRGPARNWQYKQDSGNFIDIPDSHAYTRSHLVLGLTNGTPYSFQVRSVNRAGPHMASASKSATPAADSTVVAAPRNVTAVAGDTQITLNWDPHPRADIIRSWYYKPSGGAAVKMTGAGPHTTSHTITGLTNNTAYTYTVFARTGANGTESSSVSATPAAATTLPGAAVLTATAGSGQVTLNWSKPTTGGAPKSWQVQQGSSWSDISSSNQGTRSHTVTGLSNGTAYTFRVRANNSASGSGAQSNQVTVTPGAPNAPNLATAAADGNTKIDITWTAPAAGAPIIDWEYSTDNGSTWTWMDAIANPNTSSNDLWLPGSRPATTAWEITGLNAGTYQVKVRATNHVGKGAASNTRSVTLASQLVAPGTNGSGSGSGSAGQQAPPSDPPTFNQILDWALNG